MIAIAAALVLGIALVEFGRAMGGRSTNKQANGWLVNASSEDERLELIQKHMRGFDVAMWETGERYQRLHDALTRGNSAMAVYQWDKIGQTISNGIERRPRWGTAANEVFFPAYKDIRTGLASGNSKTAWTAFEQAKASCMGCHQTSGVGHMNNQAIFDLPGAQGRDQRK
jgi:hypothetical protein